MTDCPGSSRKIMPEILAPAGDTDCFLAALSAGADAVYLGLKHFSARMQAENFGLTELSRLADLAHTHNRRVYVAMNSLLKPNELAAAFRLAVRLVRQVNPDGLIVQDLGMLDIARQAGFKKGIFLSTLANLTHQQALETALKIGASRVILPRELSIDEIRSLDASCPEGLSLECFVHGALCYCVSGRCWWSSYMGGKSGLRGRCVQPCRRLYRQGAAQRSLRGKTAHTGREGRFFSCLDLSLDVLAKTLLTMTNVISWKIEGRKKGPHYVYHVVAAYKMLRDNPSDSKARKTAEELLQMALGRPPTRAHFLPAKAVVPTDPDGQTSSGLLVGKIHTELDGRIVVKPRFDLLPKDYLRIGVEDEHWHATLPVTRRVPKAGALILKLPKHKTPKNGTPVFLIDRREIELSRLLEEWRAQLRLQTGRPSRAVSETPKLPHPLNSVKMRPEMQVQAAIPQGKQTRLTRNSLMALWLSPKSANISRTIVPRIVWWLPPIIWPEEVISLQRMLKKILRDGARQFVCNALGQQELLYDTLGRASHENSLDLLAGPFCNIANAAALSVLKDLGFSGAFISPELAAEDILMLPKQSPLPLGLILSGFWPVGISRFGLLGIKEGIPFYSPKGEIFWIKRYGGNTWLYPGWPLDLTAKRVALQTAGYSFFAHMTEYPPQDLPVARRQGLFNYDGTLL